MRYKLNQWLQAKAAPDATTNPYWIGVFYVVWIGAVWYFDWGWNLW